MVKKPFRDKAWVWDNFTVIYNGKKLLEIILGFLDNVRIYIYILKNV